jgi:hypothetical protein
MDGIQVLADFAVDLETIGAVDGSGQAYVGFVARTGGWDQASDITSWSFTSTAGPVGEFAIMASTIDVSGGSAGFTWSSFPGTQYRITASTDLTDWTTILKQDIEAEGSVTSDSVTFTPGTKMFFRVEEETPP